MSICLRRILVITAAAALLSLEAATPSHALVLDWDGISSDPNNPGPLGAWAPGNLVNSYDINGDGANDIKVQITSQQANIWRADPTSGTQTPTVNQTLTGGLSQNSLMVAADLHTNSNATVHISFTGGTAGNLPGAANVSFTLFDIDLSADRDIISNIYGLDANGNQVAATITNLGSSVSLSGTGLGQQLTGNVAAPDNSANGNATISFGSTLIYELFFTFGNSSGPPRYQDIAMGDISFTPVPEINPAAVSAGSCVAAVGLTRFLRRRAQARGASRQAG